MKVFAYIVILLVAICLSSFLTYAITARANDAEMALARLAHSSSLAGREVELMNLERKLFLYQNMVATFVKEARWVSLGFFDVTAYDPESCSKDYDGITSTGLPVGDGVFAVNPQRVPYGSLLFIPAIRKYGIAGDTGSALLREPGIIDVYIPERKDALDFGKQRLEVLRLNFVGKEFD